MNLGDIDGDGEIDLQVSNDDFSRKASYGFNKRVKT
jgi:hypothetical protein